MKVLGGKQGVCPHCGGTMMFIQVKHIGVLSQYKECSCTIQGRVKDKIYIYSEDRR